MRKARALLVELEGKTAQLEAQAIELDHAHQEAEHANLAKSQCLATMSHEIRTPLGAILGTAELLLEPELTPQQPKLYCLHRRVGLRSNRCAGPRSPNVKRLHLRRESFAKPEPAPGASRRTCSISPSRPITSTVSPMARTASAQVADQLSLATHTYAERRATERTVPMACINAATPAVTGRRMALNAST